jgi:class 3 adenylate cyclase
MIAVENGRWLARSIPGAEYVELPGDDHLWWLGDQDALLDELERFLVGAPPARVPDRVLATVLFTDIVDSTQRAAELGDRRWRDLMARHEAIVRDRLVRFRGRGDQDARGRVHVDVRRARAGDPLCRRDP